MKLSRILRCLLAAHLIFLFGLISTVQAINWDNEKFMSLDEIEKLMAKGSVKGKCKTVFRGTDVEEFELEIISIERNMMPNWDVIWAKGKGGSFDETGIAGGMSGSPCYIGEKLFGALSLGYYWQKKGDIRPEIRPEFLIAVLDKLQELFGDDNLRKHYHDHVEFTHELHKLFFYGIVPRPDSDK